MKPLVSKKTHDYLKGLEKKNPDQPDFYYNQLDAIDKLIYENGLRIKQVYFDKELDLMLVLLNNRKIIKESLSNYQQLKNASREQLQNFENDGFGIHWPDLNEDLSLKGFLNHELAQMDNPVVS